MRELLVHLNVSLRSDDPRTADEIGRMARALTDTAVRLNWRAGDGPVNIDDPVHLALAEEV